MENKNLAYIIFIENMRFENECELRVDIDVTFRERLIFFFIIFTRCFLDKSARLYYVTSHRSSSSIRGQHEFIGLRSTCFTHSTNERGSPFPKQRFGCLNKLTGKKSQSKSSCTTVLLLYKIFSRNSL